MFEAEWSIYLLLMTCQLDLDIIQCMAYKNNNDIYIVFKCKVSQAATSANQIVCSCLNQVIQVLCISRNCPLLDAVTSCLLTGCVMCKILT